MGTLRCVSPIRPRDTTNSPTHARRGPEYRQVLFKPTKATKNPFRPTGEDAMSYFVGAEAMQNDKFVGEDAGFAINGGKGWEDVVFTNHNIDLLGEAAVLAK